MGINLSDARLPRLLDKQVEEGKQTVKKVSKAKKEKKEKKSKIFGRKKN